MSTHNCLTAPALTLPFFLVLPDNDDDMIAIQCRCYVIAIVVATVFILTLLPLPSSPSPSLAHALAPHLTWQQWWQWCNTHVITGVMSSLSLQLYSPSSSLPLPLALAPTLALALALALAPTLAHTLSSCLTQWQQWPWCDNCNSMVVILLSSLWSQSPLLCLSSSPSCSSPLALALPSHLISPNDNMITMTVWLSYCCCSWNHVHACCPCPLHPHPHPLWPFPSFALTLTLAPSPFLCLAWWWWQWW